MMSPLLFFFFFLLIDWTSKKKKDLLGLPNSLKCHLACQECAFNEKSMLVQTPFSARISTATFLAPTKTHPKTLFYPC